MSALVDMTDLDLEDDPDLLPRSPGPRSHLKSGTGLFKSLICSRNRPTIGISYVFCSGFVFSRSVAALQANLRVIRHFFAKVRFCFRYGCSLIANFLSFFVFVCSEQQVVQADGKVISKRRIIAVYPYGLKFVTEPPEEPV